MLVNDKKFIIKILIINFSIVILFINSFLVSLLLLIKINNNDLLPIYLTKYFYYSTSSQDNLLGYSI
jgi:hypothetical protein